MKNLEFLTKKPIAHRGVHTKECPENSLCAFERAIKQGYPIELDVQLTLDGELVVLHDWDVNRLTGATGVINKMNYEEVNKFFLQNTKEKIPTFKQVLNIVKGRVPIIIEIKSKKNSEQVCEKVRDILQSYSGEYAVSSFNPFIIKWFRINVPTIVRGQNFTDFKNNNVVIAFFKRISLYISWFISNNNPDFFAIRARMIPNSYAFERAKKDKKIILTYAVKDEVRRDKIKDMVDNEFFDNEQLN